MYHKSKHYLSFAHDTAWHQCTTTLLLSSYARVSTTLERTGDRNPLTAGTAGEAAPDAEQAQWWEQRRTRSGPLGWLSFRRPAARL